MIVLDRECTQTYSCVAEAEAILLKHEESQRTKCSYAFQKLISIYQRCSTAGWDGRSAQPVSLMSLRGATLFLVTVPESFCCPVPGVCANGQISLEWRKQDGRLLSLAFDDKGYLNYIVFLPEGQEHCGAMPVMVGYNKTITDFLQKILE